ncbi:hypothetical protein EJ06DRAFT_84687 [Trichodelitschia bisporula]|uniref:Uncharacterized protein n=1 Tax=Trichodelitschia bisporula TaxID=703511 RepID=A0A6G1HRE2_9PEZI|nr:hypothetical protein EJ06DRAFT_84687 [Trichodelitschia bisporula]
MADQRRKLAEGTLVDKYGYDNNWCEPNWNVLAMGDATEFTFSHPLSKLFTDALGDEYENDSPSNVIGMIYLGFLYTKWLIAPSQRTYSAMPEWLRPRPIQLSVEHPLWIDYLPWRVRPQVSTRPLI